MAEPDRRLLKDKKEGDPISADEWNALKRLAMREVRGANVISDESGWLILPPPGRGGGGGVAVAGFAMVTGRAGTESPYRYTCKQAQMNIDGVWSQVPDGLVYNNCWNVEEQGHGGQYPAPLTTDDVVLIYEAPADPPIEAYVIHRAHYRGTF